MHLRTETPGWVRRAHGRVRAALLAAGVALLFLAALPGAAEEPLAATPLAQTDAGVDGDLAQGRQSAEGASPETSSGTTSQTEEGLQDPDDDIGEEDLADGELYSEIEEIQVQGRRGIMTAVDSTDSSVTFSAQDLQALGIDDISDLAKVTPNLEIRTAGSTTANFFIRGVGLADFSANAPSAVAIYQDGVSLNAPALQRAQIFDVGAVQVIRGPVASGSGRNASAGVIKIDSKKPSGNYGAEMLTRLYWFESPDVERSAMGQEYEGGIDIPIFEDWLWSRVSFLVREADPYVKNGCSDQTPKLVRVGAEPDTYSWATCGILFGLTNASHLQPGLPEFVGDRGNWGLRGQIRMKPTNWDMDWLLNAHGGRLDQDSTLGQAIGTGGNGRDVGGAAGFYYVEPDQLAERLEIIDTHDLASKPAAYSILGPILASERPLDTGPYRGDYNRVGKTTLDTWGTFLRGDIFLDSMELVTITAYEGYDRFRDVDQDFTPLVLFESVTSDSAWQFSEEIKAGGEIFDGSVRWTLGGWFLMEKMDLNLVQDLGVDLADFVRIWSQDTYGFAGYGEFEWDFLDDFTLAGGIRYNWEQKTMDYFRSATAVASGGQRSLRKETWASPTGTIQLKYRFSDLAAVYWKYTHGFKSGYFNANDVNEPAVHAEKINAIETGFRASWFDGILSMSGDVFYYRYTDYQVFVFSDEAGEPPILKILNAPRAEVYGSEIQLTLRPLQELFPEQWSGLRLQTEFGWLSSQFLEFQDQVKRAIEGKQYLKTVDYAGNKLPNSPDFTIATTAEWEIDLGSWGTLVPRYDLQWSSDIFFDQTEGLGSYDDSGKPTKYPLTVGQPAFALHNLQVLYRLPSGTAEVRLWARNITDTRYKDYAFDASVFNQVLINYVGEPRTVGFDLKLNF